MIQVFCLNSPLLYLKFTFMVLRLSLFFILPHFIQCLKLFVSLSHPRSAVWIQEQVRSGDASATELFELGAVMLRRKFYPAATKYLLQAIEKWDGDDQDLAQVWILLFYIYYFKIFYICIYKYIIVKKPLNPNICTSLSREKYNLHHINWRHFEKGTLEVPSWLF